MPLVKNSTTTRAVTPVRTWSVPDLDDVLLAIGTDPSAPRRRRRRRRCRWTDAGNTCPRRRRRHRAAARPASPPPPVRRRPSVRPGRRAPRRPPTRTTTARTTRTATTRATDPPAPGGDDPDPASAIRPADWGSPAPRPEIVDELRRRIAAPPPRRTPYSWLAPELIVLARQLGHADLAAGVIGKRYLVDTREAFRDQLRRDGRLLDAQALDHPAGLGWAWVLVVDPRTKAARLTRVRISR